MDARTPSPNSSLRDPRIARLPKVPRALAKRLGYEAGLQLMAAFGGRQIRIPTKRFSLTSGNEIACVLGEEVAAIMADLFGGETIEIPKGSFLKADALRAAILAHPGSHNEAARDLGVSRRYVRMVRPLAKPAKREAAPESSSREKAGPRPVRAPKPTLSLNPKVHRQEGTS